MRLAVVTSHPIQYNAPIFRELGRRVDLTVFYAHKPTPNQQARAGFNAAFEWDVDLLSGYQHVFLENAASDSGVHHFAGCDTPGIGDELKRGRFNALLLTGWNLKSYWQALWSAKRRGIPALVRGDSHLGTPRRAATRVLKQFTYPSMLRLFDAALYVGQRNLAYWRKYSYSSRRLFFSPHCVDAAFFASRATNEARTQLRDRLAIAPEAKIALFAGKLLDFKRPFDLLAAAQRAAHSGLGLTLMVAGSGPLEGRLRAQARQADLDVHFLGFQNQREMPAAYAACDVLVLPSDGCETWGLVANEALACARPIIVSDACGCAPDLAQTAGAGVTFPTGQIDALAEALQRVLSSQSNESAITALDRRYSIAAAVDGVCEALDLVTTQARR